MSNKEFTNINGIKVCDQTARDNIPTKTSQLTNDSNFVTDSVVDEKISNAQLSGGEVDLSSYAKITDLPTKTSQLTNDSGYITNIPDEYITETELNAKGYATTSQIPTVPTNISAFTNDVNYASETFVTNKIAEAALSGGEVDLSGYVTKETGNANQITFADGQTFQAKLDAGTLKGDKGDPGEQGPQGIQGPQGEQGPAGVDGLTTSISVNGTTYTHVDGVITLPNYPDNTTNAETYELVIHTDGLLYLQKSDGTLVGNGIEVGGSGGSCDLSTLSLKIEDQNLTLLDGTTSLATVTIPKMTDATETELTTILQRFIADGTLSALTIENGSITGSKLDKELYVKINDSYTQVFGGILGEVPVDLEWEQGGITTSGVNEQTNTRVRTSNYIHAPNEITIKVPSDLQLNYVKYTKTNETYSFISLGTYATGTIFLQEVGDDVYYRFVIRSASNTSSGVVSVSNATSISCTRVNRSEAVEGLTTTIDTLTTTIDTMNINLKNISNITDTLQYVNLNYAFNPFNIEFELGTIIDGVFTYDTARLRSKYIIASGIYKITPQSGYLVNTVKYQNYIFIENGTYTSEAINLNCNDFQYGIVVKKEDGGTISNDFDISSILSISKFEYIPNEYGMDIDTVTKPSNVVGSSIGDLMLVATKFKKELNKQPFTLGYLYLDPFDDDKFYYSVGTPYNPQYLFTWDKTKSWGGKLSATEYAFFMCPNGDVICVYKHEIMKNRTERPNAIVYTYPNYEATIITFSDGRPNPVSWLQNCGVDYNPEDESIIIGEYVRANSASNDEMNIWKITKPYNDAANWNIKLTIPRSNPGQEVNLKHIHSINLDVYTGYFYMTTGDDDNYSRFYVSKDVGETWTLIKEGPEKHTRVLNLIFLEDAVYWGTDGGKTDCHYLIKATRLTSGDNVGVIDVDTFEEVSKFPNHGVRCSTYATCLLNKPYGLLLLDRYDGNTDEDLDIYFYDLDKKSIFLTHTFSKLGSNNMMYGFRCDAVNFYPNKDNTVCCGFVNYPNNLNVLTNSYSRIDGNIGISEDYNTNQNKVNNLILSLYNRK